MEQNIQRANHNKTVYAVINNIPSFYHSADLRKFFSQFVETKGFDCFHFRHRPEHQTVKLKEQITSTSTKDGKTYCCIIRLYESKFIELKRTYHQRHWQDYRNGDLISNRCLISVLKTLLTSQCQAALNCKGGKKLITYQTRGEKKSILQEREEFSEEDLQQLPELRPPPVMPYGNVGTPTRFFQKLIQECKLPPSIIKKLQLDFPKSKGKGKYCNVPFDYLTLANCNTNTSNSAVHYVHSDGEASSSSPRIGRKSSFSESDLCREDLTSDFPNLICDISKEGSNSQPKNNPNSNTERMFDTHSDFKEHRRLKKLDKREKMKLMEEKIEENMINLEKGRSDSENDNDTCEEWERHEAIYDDVSNQDRNKDRLYEEEMEVVWEKGGSGLVFYTDAQFWEEKEGDFDEQTADDLDVDMSAYYVPNAGDKDIRDFIKIRQEQRRRRGTESTDCSSAGIGKFEKHTKGIGRKLLERHGWTDGTGLGLSVSGIANALDSNGKHPYDKKGLGYRGEKLVRYGISCSKKKRTSDDILISTVYDDPSGTDPVEPLLRRKDASYIKHRDRIN